MYDILSNLFYDKSVRVLSKWTLEFSKNFDLIELKLNFMINMVLKVFDKFDALFYKKEIIFSIKLSKINHDCKTKTISSIFFMEYPSIDITQPINHNI